VRAGSKETGTQCDQPGDEVSWQGEWMRTCDWAGCFSLSCFNSDGCNSATTVHKKALQSTENGPAESADSRRPGTVRSAVFRRESLILLNGISIWFGQANQRQITKSGADALLTEPRCLG
jgi:hypothetical protein